MDELEQRETRSEPSVGTSKNTDSKVHCPICPKLETAETSATVDNRNIVIKNLHEVTDEIDDEI